MGSSASVERVDVDLEFELNNMNSLIDVDQGKLAISEMYGLDYQSERKQLPLKPPVPNGEDRAMRIRDLQNIQALVVSRCKNERWVSTYDGKPLNPEHVNLYDLNYYLILPNTVPNGVVLIGLENRTYLKGKKVYQETTDAWQKYQRAEGIVMTTSEGTVAHIKVTRGRFVANKRVFIDGETTCGTPVFVEFKDGIRVSAKEVLHPAPTKPDWFISHWWGDSVLSFIDRCVFHARKYNTKWSAQGPIFDENAFNNYSYWVCAYANNQHELATEIVRSPLQSPFMKALTASNGTLLMLDQKGMPFSRIW